MAHVERIRISEHSHPLDCSTVYLCEFAVDGQKCAPFWSHSIDRQNLGDELWYRSLLENAEHMMAQYGPQP
jgi:hypothetical protein